MVLQKVDSVTSVRYWVYY